MPTTVTKTVGPGKDYASLNDALTGEVRDLVSADEICDIVCYAMVDTEATGVSGFTTDATRYIRIRVAPGNRHDGTRSPEAYWLHTNVDFNEALGIGQNYTRVEGLQITNDPTNGNGIVVTGTNIRIIDTLVYDCGSNGVVGAVGNSVVMNNVAAINNGGYGIGRNPVLGGSMVGYNCTSVSNGGAGFVGATDFGSTSTFKNCYSGGNGAADYEDTHGITLTTCFSEDGTASSTTAAYSINSGARFLNVTNGSEDVHHTGSSTLRHAGTDLGADGGWVNPGGQVDINGESRDPNWDVGIFQAAPDAVTNESPPTVSGYAYTGHTLTAVGGVWTDELSTAGKWQRETGVGTEIYEDIVGATSLTYVLQSTELRRRVRYYETATNLSGSTSYPSNPTAAVGTATEITVALALDTIFAANLPRYTYDLVAADAGRRIVFVETATNLNGSTDSEAAPFGPVGTGVTLVAAMNVQTDMTAELGLLSVSGGEPSEIEPALFMVMLA